MPSYATRSSYLWKAHIYIEAPNLPFVAQLRQCPERIPFYVTSHLGFPMRGGYGLLREHYCPVPSYMMIDNLPFDLIGCSRQPTFQKCPKLLYVVAIYVVSLYVGIVFKVNRLFCSRGILIFVDGYVDLFFLTIKNNTISINGESESSGAEGLARRGIGWSCQPLVVDFICTPGSQF